MALFIKTNEQPCTVRLRFKVPVGNTSKVNILAQDSEQKDTVFMRSSFKLTGDGKGKVVEIRLPISPKTLMVECNNPGNGFEFDREGSEITPLTTYPICTNQETARFVDFIKWFCLNCGICAENRQYTNKSQEFNIKFLKGLYDQQTGEWSSTPARVSMPSKVMEVNSTKFRNYTVPARMMLLLHEYAHVFLNKNPRSESEADINALYIYLGMGFNQTEAKNIWETVFDIADTPANRKRNTIIYNYIINYDKMKLWQC